MELSENCKVSLMLTRLATHLDVNKGEPRGSPLFISFGFIRNKPSEIMLAAATMRVLLQSVSFAKAAIGRITISILCLLYERHTRFACLHEHYA
jgi:hypothetical protein